MRIEKTANESFFTRVVKGTVTPQDVSVNRVLNPESVDTFIQSVTDQSYFLGKLSVTKLNKLRGNVNVLDIAPRQFKRIPEGTEPSTGDLSDIKNIGKQFDCLPMQSFFTLGVSTISDNADNADFEQEIDRLFAISVGNDVLDLGWNGTGDDGSTFLKLNKGWLQIAEDSLSTADKANKVTNGSEIEVSMACRLLAEKLPQKYKATASYIMSKSTQEKLLLELGEEVGSSLIITGKLDSFLGYPIEITAFIPDDVIVLTPLANLAWGVNREINMTREHNGRKRAIDYTFDMAMDFELAINNAFAWIDYTGG